LRKCADRKRVHRGGKSRPVSVAEATAAGQLENGGYVRGRPPAGGGPGRPGPRPPRPGRGGGREPATGRGRGAGPVRVERADRHHG
jgi:hypothetical protein